MKINFAPLEGITGYIFRNTFHEFFGKGITTYYTPFISTNQNIVMSSKEIQDLLPENNMLLSIVPQILSNQAKDVIMYAKEIKQMGYQEINLNIGCPYGTVVSKQKGAGMLANTEKLARFLEEIYAADLIKVSVKTRIGMVEPWEFREILVIYNQFKIKELIIHPRVREDFYKNKPRMEVFAEAVATSKNPICYNGDIFTVQDYEEFTKNFPEIDRIMLGRGLLANPGLVEQITEKKQLTKEQLRSFHDKLYHEYQKVLAPDRTVLFKMKELWNYMQFLFPNSATYFKKIRKAQKGSEYEAAINCLFRECELKEGAGFAEEYQ